MPVPTADAPSGERVRSEAAVYKAAWDSYEEPELDDNKFSGKEDVYLPRLFSGAHGAGLVVLRFVGLNLFIAGIRIWANSDNPIIDRIVLGPDVAPLDPVGAFIYFVMSFGIGYILIWGILGTFRGTQLEYWVRTRLNPWTAFAIGIGIYVVYIIGMSLTA